MKLKKIWVLSLFLGLLVHCSSSQSIVPHTYFKAETDAYLSKGKTKYYIKTDLQNINDSIGRFISNHPRRFQYFVKQCVNIFHLKSYAPDSLSVQTEFKKILDATPCTGIFSRLILSVPDKDTIPIKKVMQVASKFFYLNKQPNNKAVAVHVCKTLNDYHNAYNTDDLLLQSLMYEAIFEGISQEERPDFLKELNRKTPEIVKKYQQETNTDSLVHLARIEIFNTMKHSKSLKRYLIKWFNEHKNNLPIVLQ